MRETLSVVPDAGVIALARGVPSPEMFPSAALARSAQRVIESHGSVALNYGPPSGHGPLREWLGDVHGVAPDRILITPSSMIALNFLVSVFQREGGRLIVEAPTYDRMLHSLSEAGSEIVTIDRGPAGLDWERLRELAGESPRPRGLYVMPTFHNPTGRTLTLDQRHRLVELALDNELFVFEDDPYGLLRVDGEQLPHVHELLRESGGDHLAIFSSSFSKTVAPGLRVGYLILPDQLVAPLEALASRTYVSPPILPQAQLHDFLASGGFEAHLEFLRTFLRPRRDALLRALDEEMTDEAEWTRPDGGYFLWLRLPPRFDTVELAERALAAGVSFVPGAGFYPDGRGRDSARLAFSYPSADEVDEGARRLARLISDRTA